MSKLTLTRRFEVYLVLLSFMQKLLLQIFYCHALPRRLVAKKENKLRRDSGREAAS